jgi:Peptide methionine sulfoxide reductase
MLFGTRKKLEMPSPQASLPGRQDPIPTAAEHFVNKRPLKGPYPEGSEIAYFALGCYWGAEKAFWNIAGVWVTAVGNIGGYTPNPTYEELCTGLTGHAEAVMVVYDPRPMIRRKECARVMTSARSIVLASIGQARRSGRRPRPRKLTISGP